MNISTLLDELLAAAVEALGEPYTPARRYVAHGRPANDCEQLTTHLGALRFVNPDGFTTPVGGCIVVPRATLVVTGWWCWPGPVQTTNDGAPTAETLDEAGHHLAAVGQALGTGLADQWAECGLFSSPILMCSNVLLLPGLEPIPPQGGYAGWTFTLDVQE